MAKDETNVNVAELPAYREIEYMQRRIGATATPGADAKATVKAEVAKMFADGWKLFATHYGGDKGSGVLVLHIFVR